MSHSKHWIGVGALLLAAAGFAALGRWQLDRAELHRTIEAGFRQAADEPAIERPPDGREVGTQRYRRIRLSGRYRAERQILLDNMTLGGQAGYQVLTPFRVSDGGLVLVNRGWVPASADRDRLPEVDLANERTEITGRVDRLPRAALTLAGETGGNESLAVLSFPDFAAIEAVLGQAVYPFQVLLDAGAPFGFAREWAPPPGRDERNIAYAVQWFGLGLLALGLAIGMLVRRARGRREAAT